MWKCIIRAMPAIDSDGCHTPALAHAAGRHNYNGRYYRSSRLLYATEISLANGFYPGHLDAFAWFQLFILNDWLGDPLTVLQSQNPLEILDDRQVRSSTLVATQVPVAEWHVGFPNGTIGDATLDPLVRNAYRLTLMGDSRLKNHSHLPRPAQRPVAQPYRRGRLS